MGVVRDQLGSLSINELRSRVKKLDLYQRRGIKKNELIEILKAHVGKKIKRFKKYPKKRGKYKPLLDSFNLKFNGRRFKLKKEPKKDKIINIKYIFKKPYRKNETGFKGRLSTYRIDNNDFKDVRRFLKYCNSIFIELIRKKIRIHRGVKCHQTLNVIIERGDDDDYQEMDLHINSGTKAFTRVDNILDILGENKLQIENELNLNSDSGSGWRIKEINYCDLAINKYKPLRGSSYIDLPKQIKDKKAIINIKNNDNKCFLWSVLAALHPVNKNSERVSNYKKYENDFGGIEFPMEIKNINSFEKKNNLCINVLSYDESLNIYPLYISKEKSKTIIDLLYINGDHYCLIKSLSRLLSSQFSKHRGETYICKRCFSHYGREDLLEKHQAYCENNEALRAEFPKYKYIKFKNYKSKMKVPFAIYADFESFLYKVKTTQPNPINSYTQEYQKHKPCGFSYYVTYGYGERETKPFIYRGENAAEVFVDKMIEETQKIYNFIKNTKKSMIFKREDRLAYDSTNECHICEKEIEDIKYKVRDHCHLTGKFRGAAHDECNKQFQLPRFVPIFFHNLQKYDAHLFIKELSEKGGNLSVISKTEQNYISFSSKVIVDSFQEKDEDGYKTCNLKPIKFEMRFLDSLGFMTSSLDKLSKTLEIFPNLEKYFPKDKIPLITRKLPYCYDYIDSNERFKETNIPPKKSFYNRLNDSKISDEEYTFVKRLWRIFKIKNVGEFHDLYLTVDTLLLADIFENFREICMKIYKLDPCHYFTAPGLSWNAMLKSTNIKLEVIKDYDMLLMIEKGIRGGINQVTKRYSKANNKYMKDYNKKEESKYLMYLDMNNLYGAAMIESLPYRDFKWVENTIDFKVEDIPDESKKGYILEVDLEYPKELHKSHDDYPLAPESMKVESEWLSPYQKQFKETKYKKQIITLMDKNNYVIHYKTLKLYLSLGVKIKKIHKIISFKQSKWLKKYIDLNTNMRTKATNDFEKDFFKLMNNSVFGKTMQNIRKMSNIKVLNEYIKVEKEIAKPTFKKRTIFSEKMVALYMGKERLVFDKPIYVGMSILDLSKYIMYDFHYNVMKKKYDENIKVCYTDTDSFVYEIKTEDFYKDMENMNDHFDTSNFPDDHWMPKKNKKVLGKMKDENGGKIMREHIGLRSKMYAIKLEGNEEIKKSKGTKKCVVDKTIKFDDYYDCLFNKEKQYRVNNQIRSNKHEISTIELNKIALSPYDDKRYILDDGINTRAYGSNYI